MNAKISNGMKSFKGYMVKHSPEILTGIGIAGMISSTVLAVKATPKAISLLEEKKQELGTDDLTYKEIISTAWRPYIPSISVTIASMICIIGAVQVNSKRNAAIATAYSLSERAFSTYRDKVIETIGEKKEKDIRDKARQEELDKNPSSQRQILITPKGQTLCMDTFSGRYFRSDLDLIRKSINELNRSMTYQNYISLNQYYSAIGLDPIKEGDYMGWNIDGGLIDLDFSACITDTDEPCVVIDYNIRPKEGFDR